MDIKNFNTKQEYNLEPKPTTESVVSHINEVFGVTCWFWITRFEF